MTNTRERGDQPPSNTQKNPDDWKTGDERMTGAQRSYLQTLSDEAGEPVDDTLTKAEASKRIDELRHRTGRGLERDAAAASPPDDARQQPWTGSDAEAGTDPHSGQPLAEQDRPDEGGVRTERPMDERSSSPADVNSTTASGRSAREDVTNTSDSSGLRAGDEAAGERMKDQLRRGATEVSRMD